MQKILALSLILVALVLLLQLLLVPLLDSVGLPAGYAVPGFVELVVPHSFLLSLRILSPKVSMMLASVLGSPGLVFAVLVCSPLTLVQVYALEVKSLVCVQLKLTLSLALLLL